MLDSSNTIGVNSSSLVIHRGRFSVTNLESPSDQCMGIVSPTQNLVINADDARSRQNRMNPGDRYLETKRSLPLQSGLLLVIVMPLTQTLIFLSLYILLTI